MDDQVLQQPLESIDSTRATGHVGRGDGGSATALARNAKPCFACRTSRKKCEPSAETGDARCKRCRVKDLPLAECTIRVDYRELLKTYLLFEEIRNIILRRESPEDQLDTISVASTSAATSVQIPVVQPTQGYDSLDFLGPGNISSTVSSESTSYRGQLHTPAAIPTHNRGFSFHDGHDTYFRYNDSVAQPQMRVLYHDHGTQPAYAQNQVGGPANTFFGMQIERPYNAIPSTSSGQAMNSFNDVINNHGPPGAGMNVNASAQSEGPFDYTQGSFNAWQVNERTS